MEPSNNPVSSDEHNETSSKVACPMKKFGCLMHKQRVVAVFSWLAVLWIVRVFVVSLFYKFTDHPDTQYIFSTIGLWIEGTLSVGLGQFFAHYGAYLVGVFELATSIVLLLPAVFWVIARFSKAPSWTCRAGWHCIGGLMAGMVMTGAAFFHLFTPLGIEVLHNGQPDGGSLFKAAVSICLLGYLMFVANGCLIIKNR